MKSMFFSFLDKFKGVDSVLIESVKTAYDLCFESEDAECRSKPNPTFDSTNSKVNDNKDHFPIGTIEQARNAIARVNQYNTVPTWYNGTLTELKNKVINKVKRDYPSIEIT